MTFEQMTESLKNRVYNNEQCYLIGKNYHGLYEDDWCYFTYYDQSEGKIFEELWTTAGACPGFGLYEPQHTIEDAIENGFVTKEEVENAMKSYVKEHIGESGVSDQLFSMLNIERYSSTMLYVPCTVKGGRKYQGNAVLVCYEENPYSRYGREVYGIIITPAGEVQNIQAKYIRCEVDHKAIKDKAEELFDKEVTLEQAKANIMDYDHITGRATTNMAKALLPLGRTPELASIYEAHLSKKSDEHKEKVLAKRAGLLAWCEKTFAGKSEEEINIICDRIMKKKYGIEM